MVRFADGPETRATLVIDAAPEQVWPLVTDIRLPTEHSEELHDTEWLDGATGPAEGVRFRGHNRRGDTEWSTECTITEFDPPRRFTWVVGPLDDAVATWGFTLSPTEDGQTEVRQWTRLGPGRSGLTWAIRQRPEKEERIVAGRLDQLRTSMQANLETVRARLSG